MNNFSEIYEKLHSETTMLEKGILDTIKNAAKKTATVAGSVARTAGSAIGMMQSPSQQRMAADSAKKMTKISKLQSNYTDTNNQFRSDKKNLRAMDQTLRRQGIDPLKDAGYLQSQQGLEATRMARKDASAKLSQESAKYRANIAALQQKNREQNRRLKTTMLGATEAGTLATHVAANIAPVALATERPRDMPADSTAPQPLRSSLRADFDRLYKTLQKSNDLLDYYDERLLKILPAAVVAPIAAVAGRVASAVGVRAVTAAATRAATAVATRAAASAAARAGAGTVARTGASAAARSGAGTVARTGSRTLTTGKKAGKNSGWNDAIDAIDTVGSFAPDMDSQSTQEPTQMPTGRQRRNYTEPEE